jgi:uncharacterized protein
MSKSLQEQLLGAQLVDAKKAKQIAKDARKAKNVQRRSKEDTISDSQAAALKAKQEKVERDIALNKQRNLDAEKRALAAQVKQMILHYRLPTQTGVQAREETKKSEYKFTDGKLIKKIYVASSITEEIIRGRLCIARLNEHYEIIPRPIAEKIRERDEQAIVVFNKTPSELKQTHTSSDDDYYAQFAIPDDLDW